MSVSYRGYMTYEDWRLVHERHCRAIVGVYSPWLTRIWPWDSRELAYARRRVEQAQRELNVLNATHRPGC